ncbi:MAG: UDP-N-acetylmuramoyl-L-alanine--D-glutamate ligase [bacterium]
MLDLSSKRNIHLVGISGAEISSVAEFLIKRGIPFIAHDTCEEADFKRNYFSFHDWMTEKEKARSFEFLRRNVRDVRFGDRYLEGVLEADLIFVSQAWFRYPKNFPTLKLARERGIPFYNITKLYLELAPCPIIGVTGTNGKSTTTALINSILNLTGKRVFFSGNDRNSRQVLGEMDDITGDDILLLEISNRQLIDLGRSPNISVITNISPNHIDDHGSFESYIEVKREIVRWQGPGDWKILNYDDPIVRDFSSASGTVFYSAQHRVEGVHLRYGEIAFDFRGRRGEIVEIGDLKILGIHNVYNAMAAAGAALALGIDPETIRRGLSSFKGLPHRLEFIREVEGVSYYEDSAGCNPLNPAYAIRAFSRPLVLIAGGYRKVPLPNEFDPLARAIWEGNILGIVLIGDTAGLIAGAIEKFKPLGRELPVFIEDSLPRAVGRARSLARPGGAVVFSPGCESFGWFRDYRDRGEQFQNLVKGL